MHETALAQDIIDIVQETSKRHPDATIKTVRVIIGEMVAVVPELLYHAYDSLVSNTTLCESKLDIEIIPVSAECTQCRQSFGVQEFEFSCPYCHSSRITVKSGNEFYIEELEVESCPS